MSTTSVTSPPPSWLRVPAFASAEQARQAGPVRVRAELTAGLAVFKAFIRDLTERKRAEEERRNAYRQLERGVAERTRELSTLLEVSRTVTSTLELTPLLGLILDQLQGIVDYSAAGIHAAFDQHAYAMLEYRGPLPRERMLGSPTSPELVDLLREAEERQYPILLKDLGGQTTAMRQLIEEGVLLPPDAADHAHAILCAPLLVKGVSLGGLFLMHPQPGFYTDRHAQLAFAFAQQAAAAIENARLYEQARDKAILEERQRLARELHDSVTQELYTITVFTEAARRQLRCGDAEIALSHMREVRAAAKDALGEMRILLFELRPPIFEDQSLGTALRTRLASVEARAGLVCDVDIDEGLRLSETAELELYRIASEALSNVLKHAHARRVTVSLTCGEDRVRLAIADDGRGFDPSRQRTGFGVPGMEERARRLGTTLQVRSGPGGGTQVLVEVPR